MLLCSWIFLCSGFWRGMKSRAIWNFLDGKKKIKDLDLDKDARTTGWLSFAALLRFFGVLDWKALSLDGLWLELDANDGEYARMKHMRRNVVLCCFACADFRYTRPEYGAVTC
jgi:hypothetical protein